MATQDIEKFLLKITDESNNLSRLMYRKKQMKIRHCTYKSSSIDIVSKWKEGIAAQSNVIQFLQPFESLAFRQFCRNFLVHSGPYGRVHILSYRPVYIIVDGVRDFCSFYAFFEFHSCYLWMLAKPPVIK